MRWPYGSKYRKNYNRRLGNRDDAEAETAEEKTCHDRKSVTDMATGQIAVLTTAAGHSASHQAKSTWAGWSMSFRC